MNFFGIDVGNYDTKSENTTIPSGYNGPNSNKPIITNQLLEYKNQYFSPSEHRLYYLPDKTKDERGMVLTLMSIAEEMIFRFSRDTQDRNVIQSRINEVTEICLGVGLPASHYKREFVESLVAHYTKNMANGISFSYDGYAFYFKMVLCKVFPQGGAAAMCKSNKISGQYEDYYTADIGGYTVDITLFKSGKPTRDMVSFDMGIITMYDAIKKKAFQDYNVNLNDDVIKAYFSGKNTILTDEVKKMMFDSTQEHASNIINAMRQEKISFDSLPVLFVGGGSTFLKPFLLRTGAIHKGAYFFITDARANAKGYALLVKQAYESH